METDQNKLREKLKELFDKPSMNSFAIDNGLSSSWFHGWMKGTKKAGLKSLEKINNGLGKLHS